MGGGESKQYLAYNLLFRQLIMTFIYPSVLKIFRPAFIPLYNEIKRNEGEEAAARFSRGVMEIGMLLGFLVFLVLWTMPSFTVNLLAPSFGPDEHAISVQLMRQMAPGILCLLFAEMYLMLFHAEKKFGVPHGAEAAQKIAWGVAIFVAGKFFKLDLAAIGLGYAAACVLQLAINVVGMRRTFGWVLVYTSLGSWMRTWGKRAGWLVLPLLVGILAARFRDLLTVRVQSQLDAVYFNGVETARQLTNLPVAFLGQIVSLVMLPHLASILHGHGKDMHRETLEGTVTTLWLLTIPVISVTFVLAPELVSLIYIGKEWTPERVIFCNQTALAARVIALGMTFMMLENILLPGLFSIKSMWWPTLWGLAASACQILLLVGLASAGLPRDSALLVVGVAVVYPLSRIFKNLVLLMVLRRKTGIFGGAKLVTFLLKMLALTGCTLLLTFATRKVGALILPAIPHDGSAGFIAYKLITVLHLALPTIVTLCGFLAMVVAVGYRQQMQQLVALARARKKKGKTTESLPNAEL